MPELPEVETIVRRLKEVTLGKTLTGVTVLRSKSFVGDPDLLVGAKITNITRRSKIMEFHFDKPERMLVHLKMTGQLIYQDSKTRVGGGHPTADWVSSLPSTHTRVTLSLSDNAQLFFNDLRVFGWMKVLSPAEVLSEYAALGPDIIDPAVTPEYLFTQFQRRGVPIKLALMDNAIAAGVGNIYANDALHLAKISPFRPARSLTQAEVLRLHSAVQAVIISGIEKGGATIEHFRHVDGFAGGYQDVVRTYGKTGQPCLVCGTAIIRQKQAGRSTFYCPSCQV